MAHKSFNIALECDDGHLVQAKLNSRMHRRCPAISAIPPGTILRGVQAEPFNTVTSYLDGDDSLSTFASHIDSNAFLLLFAQTWVLAARLGLPTLQNELLSFMTNVHAKIADGGNTGSNFQYAADESLLLAFQHLRDQIGRNSHAENFLICFAGRTAPLICELERNLNKGKIDRAIRDEILAEARSFGPDSIKHQPQVFLVNHEKPPKYPPLKIQSNKPGLASGYWTPSEAPPSIIVDEAAPQLPQMHGKFGNDMRKQASKTFVPKHPLRRPRSPYPTSPRPRSPLPDWSDEASGLKVRMQPGDPDVPGLWYPSQAVDFDDHSPPIIDHDGVLHPKGRDNRDPGRPPSLPSLSSLPPLPPASPPTYSSSQPSFGRFQDHETKAPYIIQILQHNNNAHDNANRIHNGDNNTAIAQAQGGGRRRNGTVRAVANSGGHSYKLIRERKGKRCKWFSLLACGSKHY